MLSVCKSCLQSDQKDKWVGGKALKFLGLSLHYIKHLLYYMKKMNRAKVLRCFCP